MVQEKYRTMLVKKTQNMILLRLAVDKFDGDVVALSVQGKEHHALPQGAKVRGRVTCEYKN